MKWPFASKALIGALLWQSRTHGIERADYQFFPSSEHRDRRTAVLLDCEPNPAPWNGIAYWI